MCGKSRKIGEGGSLSVTENCQLRVSVLFLLKNLYIAKKKILSDVRPASAPSERVKGRTK